MLTIFLFYLSFFDKFNSGPPKPTNAEQTIIESNITNPDSIEKRTRYRELPSTAQNELNALYQFINQQMDISKAIGTRQSAYNGELISEIENYADNCSKVNIYIYTIIIIIYLLFT